MHISSIQIKNYKSYCASDILGLSTGINVITGQNNVGKTALLEALSLSIQDRPHRSIATSPKVGMFPPSGSTINITLSATFEELKETILAPGNVFRIAAPRSGTVFSGVSGQSETIDNQDRLNSVSNWLFSQPLLEFNIVARAGTTLIALASSFKGYEADTDRDNVSNILMANFQIQNDGQCGPGQLIGYHADPQDFGHNVAHLFQQRIYSFHAERFNLGICAFGPNTVLKSNAANLAEVLSNLNNNPARFARFNNTVREVLPQVRLVTVKNLSQNRLEVFIWNDDPGKEREDLAVSLNESGTGVGQVLSIVYVVLNSDHPRTILIDEPQSFLHPGAVRKLIEVLKKYPQHQYIITTHSPTVISAANPSTITLIKQRGCESEFHVIDPRKNEQLRQYLIEIGARLSDAFGADGILWVEGPTEEICFPMILEKVAKRFLMGTAIIAVKQTGDLEGRHAKSIFEIYRRLTEGGGLLPPAIGFIFDKEDRPEKDRKDIEYRSNNLVAFTPRRLYENYLLNPEAIAALANGIEGFRDRPITPAEVRNWINDEVAAWLDGKRVNRKYGTPPKLDVNWIEFIHGAKLLEHLFGYFSENRVSYQKIPYSVDLTKWVLDHSPEDLREVADLIGAALDAAEKKLMTST